MARVNDHSCGILLYRKNPGEDVEVFLVEANSPHFWNNPHANAWGVPNGGREGKETVLETAKREFFEEVGVEAPDVTYSQLPDYLTHYGKTITVFTGDATGLDVDFNGSVTTSREWPPKSGRMVSYEEATDAQWFRLSEAEQNIMESQQPILHEFLRWYINRS